MKKLLTLLLSILVCFSLVGCNKKDNTTNETVIEPTINEIVEVPNNTIQEEVVTEEVTTTEVKEEVKDNTTLSYWVNFLNKDGSVLQRTVYKYGETPSYKGTTPTYTDYAYYYSFKGWDKQTSPVKGTQTYTALYDIVGEVPSDKTSDTTPTVTPNYLTFTAAHTSGSSSIALNKVETQEGNLEAVLQYRTYISGTTSEWSAYVPGTFSSPNKINLPSAGDYVQFKAATTNLSFSKDVDNYYIYRVYDGKIAASGDITSLLNGTGELLDISNQSYNYCFTYLFSGNDKLISAPILPSTALAKYCYSYMFYNCTDLTLLPVLPATSLAERCYYDMFAYCTKIKLSTIKTGLYTTEYRIPLSGTGITVGNSLEDMFADTGGTFTGTPSINTTYYLYTKNLTFTAKTTGSTVALNKNGSPANINLQYSTDGVTWNDYYINGSYATGTVSNSNGVITLPIIGSFVQFKPATTNSSFSKNANDYYYFAMTGSVSASGCINSLLSSDVENATLSNYCFRNLFLNCASLTTAPALLSTTLTDYCYSKLFEGCTSLAIAPALPATTLKEGCYYSMFSGCSSLTTPPALPATKLAISCYASMFYNCSSLYVYVSSGTDNNTQISYDKPWKIPSNGSFEDSMSPMDMFYLCKSDITYDDVYHVVKLESGKSKTFYTQNTPVE